MNLGGSGAHFEVSPKLLERWKADWRTRGELAFPGNGVQTQAVQGSRETALERKIGQQAIEIELQNKALQRFGGHPLPATGGKHDSRFHPSTPVRGSER